MDREKLKEEFRDFVTEREDAKVNWWLNKFDQHLLTLRKRIEIMKSKYTPYPAIHSETDGMERGYEQALEDVLNLFNQTTQ